MVGKTSITSEGDSDEGEFYYIGSLQRLLNSNLYFTREIYCVAVILINIDSTRDNTGPESPTETGLLRSSLILLFIKVLSSFSYYELGPRVTV